MTRSTLAPSTLLLGALALVGLAACGTDGGPPDAATAPDAALAADAGSGAPDAMTAPDAAAGGADAAAGGADAGAGAPDAGAGRDPSCPASASWVTAVEGTLVDDDDSPIDGAMAQLCVRSAPNGILTCLRPTPSGAGGAFAINVPSNVRCMDEATMRYLRPLEDRTVGYCAIDLGGAEEVVRVDEPFRIFPTTRPRALPPLGDAMASRTVTFSDGIELDLVPADYFPGAGEYADLASVRLGFSAVNACILAGEPAFDGVIAFSPEGDLHGRAAVRVPNLAALAPNQAVAVFVFGGLGCTLDDGTPIPEGTWARLEDARVSPDGTSIAMTPGLPCLSWMAYRGL